jgi:glutathione S-transferase
MSTREIETFRLQRTFPAAPEDVFDAWTNPEVLERWWAARPSWTSPGCEVDLRVGGRYLLRMRDEETGEVHTVGGSYREIVRPSLLVYTWCWEGTGGPDPGHVSVVSVEFRADGEGTTVVLEHSGLPSAQSRIGHGEGWKGTFDNLARRIFNAGERS